MNFASAGPARGLFDQKVEHEPKHEAPESAEGFSSVMKKTTEAAEQPKGEHPASRTVKETKVSQEAVEDRPEEAPTSQQALAPKPGKPAAAEAPKAKMAEGESKDQEKPAEMDAKAKQTAIAALLAGVPVQVPAKASATPTTVPVAGKQAAVPQVAVKGASAKAGEVDAKLVNELLKEKSAAPLSAQEVKLLAAVNEKLSALEPVKEEAPSQAVLALLAEIKVAKEAGEAEGPAEGMAAKPEAKLAQALVAKGVDPQAVRGVPGEKADGKPEAPKAAAEGFVPTETYLKLHAQGDGKAPVARKEDAEAKLAPGPAGAPLKAVPTLGNGATASLAAAGGEGKAKGQDLLGGNAKGKEKILGAGTEKDAGAGAVASPFGHDLLASLRAEGTKEVHLSGANPQAIRAQLSAEVNNQVQVTALKGGGEMRLVIRPDGLGEVKVKVESKDGKIGVHLVAENEQVAKAIRGGSQDLERSLRDQNLTLAKFEVQVKSDSAVAESNTRNLTGEQFQSHDQSRSDWSQQNFAQGRNEQRFEGWNQNQGQRQGNGTREALGMEDAARSNPAFLNRSFAPSSSRTASGRLNVVA